MVKRFSAARALWDNREPLSEALPELRAVRTALQAAIGGPRDFVRQHWLQLVSAVYAFKPDLVIELGRGYGNSTCALSIAAKMLRPQPCRILSLCLANSFVEISRPYLDSCINDPTLFAPLTALNQDISTYDFARDVERAERVFVFWDAHGYELAMALLSGLFQLLQGKPHLCIVHDMADLKYMEQEYRRYDQGTAWLKAGSAPPKYILGDVGSQFEEGVALVDFLGRNGLAFHSAESSYFPELTDQQIGELKQRFGDDFSQFGFWYHFSLNEADHRPLTFPPIQHERATTSDEEPASSLPANNMRTLRKPSLLTRILRR